MSGTERLAEELSRLAELHRAGALDDDEFVAANRQVLASSGTGPARSVIRGAAAHPGSDGEGWDGEGACPNCGTRPPAESTANSCEFCEWPMVRPEPSPTPAVGDVSRPVTRANATCPKCHLEQVVSRFSTSSCVGCGTAGQLVECRSCHTPVVVWQIGESKLTWTCGGCNSTNFATWFTQQQCLCGFRQRVPPFPRTHDCDSPICDRTLLRLVCSGCGAGNSLWRSNRFFLKRTTWTCVLCNRSSGT
jgi:hypothetical protein